MIIKESLNSHLKSYDSLIVMVLYYSFYNFYYLIHSHNNNGKLRIKELVYINILEFNCQLNLR